MARPSVALNVRIPEDLGQRLRTEADARGVTVTWMVKRLLSEGLERIEPASDFRLTRED